MPVPTNLDQEIIESLMMSLPRVFDEYQEPTEDPAETYIHNPVNRELTQEEIHKRTCLIGIINFNLRLISKKKRELRENDIGRECFAETNRKIKKEAISRCHNMIRTCKYLLQKYNL